ncbi:PPE family protein [Mycobacterium shinjukuense]|uniref:PPE family protein n=1 Tax=Mycobacterium shinjukuense TaxID=398694 RepID=A0A7I7MN48_9MYCO|nr:PPE family protein [Mycobacterium shinjukuense]MCV6985814.1 PPE family protein [Mycobacterium shinjukuense]ORB71783.1 hypothetical protein BST45_02010 [Mycobacterium shinjukuense]BBX73694.1 PPE family protein [Mycobacterium shinjukuense]
MDFGSLPPEINSTRIYAGPGSGPMLAAAAAWDVLAAELITAASGYQAVTAQLASGPWLGAASVSMLGAAGIQVSWLHTTATHAEQTATQARVAAGAYEVARATSVPPPMVFANRALLMALIATNILGQNTPAIAATEAHYGEMWAQDATAMYAYAASSASAAKVTPFAPPAATTNPAGLAGQAAAVAQAVGSAAGIRAQETVAAGQQLVSAVPRALQGLASPGSGSRLSSLTSRLADLESLAGPGSDAASTVVGAITDALNLAGAANSAQTVAGAGVQAVGSGLGALTSAAPSGLGGGPGVTAGVARAATIGALSVPPSWAWAATGGPIGTALSSTGGIGVPVAGQAGVPLMPVAGLPTRGAGADASSRFTLRANVVPRPLVGG